MFFLGKTAFDNNLYGAKNNENNFTVKGFTNTG